MPNFIAAAQQIKTQIISILAVSIYLGSLFFATYKSKIFREPKVAFTQPSSAAIELANHVEVGLHINSFPAFSFKNTTFTLDGILWFKFDKGMESIETLENFLVKNVLLKEKGKIFYRSQPMIVMQKDKVIVSFHTQFTFRTDINFKKFPIGDHRVNLQIENRDATAHELLFSIDPKNITFNKVLLIDDWRPIHVNVASGIIQTQFGPKEAATSISYPGFGISIDFENIGARFLISLYFPLFVLFFIGLLSLSLGIFDPNRFIVLATSLPTLVLFRLVVDAVSPEVGYATHIDFVYYVLVMLSLIILFFQTYIMLSIERVKTLPPDALHAKQKRLELINTLLFISILGALIVIMTIDFLI